MEHLVIVSFAASLRAGDGNGIRLCAGLRRVPAKSAPSRNITLHIAGFRFKQFNDSLVKDDHITYILEPVDPVRFERIKLSNEKYGEKLDKNKRRIVSQVGVTDVGVLVSKGSNTIINLIETLKKQGYQVVIGSRKDGGFNPYPSD